MRAMQQVLRGHALQHHRRRGLVAHVVGKHDHLVRGQRAHRRVRAGRRAGIRDAVARQQVRDAIAHVEHDARRFHADRRGRLDHAVEALADVDVDVVHADRRLADAHFVRSRRHDRDRFVAQHLGAAERRRDDRVRRLRIAIPRGSGSRQPRRGAGTPAGPRSRPRRLPCRPALELLLASARHVERRLPVPEGAVAVGHALELHGGDVVLHRQRGVEDAVGGDVVAVGKRQQLLADVVAVLEGEVPHAADLVGRPRRSRCSTRPPPGARPNGC